jgi:hypothetical protein
MPVLVWCYRVIIHGAFSAQVKLDWEVPAQGFYTTRWVVASNRQTAIAKAFLSARRELDRWADIRDGLIAIDMEATDVGPGSWWRWLKSGGRGFSFYAEE